MLQGGDREELDLVAVQVGSVDQSRGVGDDVPFGFYEKVSHLDALGGERVVVDLALAAGQRLDQGALAHVRRAHERHGGRLQFGNRKPPEHLSD